MQKWRRLAGVIITAISIANLSIFSLPGHIYNANQWLVWIRRIDVDQEAVLAFFVIGIFAGVLLTTSDLWLPHVLQRVKRITTNQKSQEVESGDTLIETVIDPDSFVGRLRACHPQIRRCRELVEPYRGEKGVSRIEWRQFGSDEIGEFRDLDYELGYLTRRLDRLYIPSPSIAEGPGTNVGDLNESLQQWGWFLEKLEATVLQDDLHGARAIWDSPPPFVAR